MKAVLLTVELKYPIARCQREIDALTSKLPGGSFRAIYTEGKNTVTFIIPPVHAAIEETHARLRFALAPFRDYWLMGMSGETIAKNGLMDPLVSGMRQYHLPPVRRRERAETQHVPQGEGRQPRSKLTVDDLISRTVANTPLESWAWEETKESYQGKRRYHEKKPRDL